MLDRAHLILTPTQGAILPFYRWDEPMLITTQCQTAI